MVAVVAEEVMAAEAEAEAAEMEEDVERIYV